MTKAKEKWLIAGLDLLVKKGEGGLTIEVLCGELGKTKGSFYHHFAGRTAYCEALLEYWEQKHTEELIQATGPESPGALGELHQLTLALPLERETAFRGWAVNSEQAEAVVRRVDISRVEHLKRLYMSAGKSSKAAQKMAWLEYCLFLGASQLGETFPKADRRDLHELIQKMEATVDD